MKENVLEQKVYQFALRIVNLYRYLVTKNEYALSKQMLRAGTSIGANLEEALGGSSKRDFLAKITICYKEAREVHFWLRLLHDGHYISDKQANSMLSDCEELLKILTAIQKTLKSRR